MLFAGALDAVIQGFVTVTKKNNICSLLTFVMNLFHFLAGVGMVLRKMGNTVSPTVDLVKDGDEYTFNTVSTFKSTSIKFKLGEEFDEETLDGRKVKSNITLDGNKLVQEQKGDKPHTIIREFTDTDLTVTMTLNNITCKRVYKAV